MGLAGPLPCKTAWPILWLARGRQKPEMDKAMLFCICAFDQVIISSARQPQFRLNPYYLKVYHSVGRASTRLQAALQKRA